MRFLKLTLILRDEAWRVRRGKAYWVLGSRLKLSVLWLGVSLRLCNPLRAALKGAHIFVYASLELSSHWATCRALYCSLQLAYVAKAVAGSCRCRSTHRQFGFPFRFMGFSWHIFLFPSFLSSHVQFCSLHLLKVAES